MWDDRRAVCGGAVPTTGWPARAAAEPSAVAVASVRPVVAARETFGFSTESKTPCAYLKSQDVKDMYGESVQRSGHRTSSSADHVQ